MSPKRPLSLASLKPEFRPELGITLAEWLKLDWQDKAQLVAYFDNTNRPPKNFPANSEAFRQWTFTGRKKGDKDLLDKTLKGE